MIGRTLGPYRVLAKLGEGGMGEVYRARDPRLGREVAVKVLPALLASDAEHLARFEREAQVLASLNHPGIAQLYGVEDSDGVRALVMEIVEGPTLAERLLEGRLPIPDVLAIGKGIAEALEAAHDLGIVHRDLKPANVKIRPDGSVKVLDFGLAKAHTPDLKVGPTSADANSPTIVGPTFRSGEMGTQAGVILGTLAYMSPEQARGRPVDRRSDIWAFGVVLFEMLSGARPFAGDTMSDTLAAVLTKDPDWARLPTDTPAPIVQLLRRCLERDPLQRLQAIGEARLVLGSPTAAADSSPRTGRSARWIAGAIAAVGVVAAVVGFVARPLVLPPREVPQPLRKLDIDIPGFLAQLDVPTSISPDGTAILFSSGGRLWVRRLDDFTAKPVEGFDGGHYPFWSPDSREVGFVRDRQAWRVPVGGGNPTPVGSVPGDLSGSGAGIWTTDGQMVFAGSNTTGLFSVSAARGDGKEIVPLIANSDADFHEVAALPDGAGLLFTVHGPRGTDRIDAFVGGKRKTVFELPRETLRWPAYVAGYLVYGRETTSPGVWAIRFSLDRLETEGEPMLVAATASRPTVAADGTLAVIRHSDMPSELVAADRTGRLQPFGQLKGQYFDADPWAGLAISPDGRRLAINIGEASGSELWSYEIERGTMTRLTMGARVGVSPVWQPDGSRILVAGFFGHLNWNVFAVSASETSTAEAVLSGSAPTRWPCTVSRDGKWLVYVEGNADDLDLWLMSLETRSVQRLMRTPSEESDAKFSPDGRWLAYVSNESGRNEVYVRRFPIDADRRQVSTSGGVFPLWSANGQELFFRTATGVAHATVTPSPGGVNIGEPAPLFPLPADSRIFNTYALLPAGGFLFVRATGDDRVSIIQNWIPQLALDQSTGRAR